MNKIVTIILGGGQGTRLCPLTITRCKPAVSFGGRYRLIDIPISNAINSGCTKLFIITQFLSGTLHEHIFKTYRPSTFSPGFIQVLSAEQGPTNSSWFQGTADAVRKNKSYLEETEADYFLILSGDQIYNLNFHHMLTWARNKNADLVVASLPVHENDAKRMGVLKLDENYKITDFYEKPQDFATLSRLQSPHLLQKNDKPYLGSMGIYLFKRQVLFDLLQKDAREDFGSHLIPTQVKEGNSFAYLHDGYWEDIGTIDSFFRANIALTMPDSPFNCYDESNPIFSRASHLPAPKISRTKIIDAIICEGSLVEAEEIKNSILGPRSVVKKGCVIRNSYLIGNDYYTPPKGTTHVPQKLEIEENCLIDHAIIDKHVHIGKGVTLINKDKLTHYNSDHVFIRDGIIVVTHGAHLPDGFTL